MIPRPVVETKIMLVVYPKIDKASQSGFTLLEVLITVIILSVGLLGLAGLQVISLRDNHSAYLRSQALIQSYDIVDRMRANDSQISNYSLTDGSYAFSAIGAKHQNCDQVAGCTKADKAAHDLFQWNQANRRMLPSAIGIVCRDGSMEDGNYDMAADIVTTGCTNAAADPLVVKIWWVDDRTNTVTVFRFSTAIGDAL